MISKLASTAAVGFGAGMAVGFLAASMLDAYEHPQPTQVERQKVERRLEIVAAATGVVGAAIFVLGDPGIMRQFGGALVASGAFSFGILVHGTLSGKAPIANLTSGPALSTGSGS